MSVWNDRMLHDICRNGLVTPYHKAQVNPASYDLQLGDMICVPNPVWKQVTPAEAINMALYSNTPHWTEPQPIGEYHVLMPGKFILCHSAEYVRIPTNAMALLFSKSSMGRIGMEHLHAGLGDPGFHGQWVFEFHNVGDWPIIMRPGKCYMQMALFSMEACPDKDYSQTGRYQEQTGPTPAREAKA